MKKETYLKIKKQKRRAKALAVLTALSLSLYAIKSNKTTSNDTIEEVYSYEPVEIVDMNGVLYPTIDEGFYNVDYDVFARMSIQLRDSYKYDGEMVEIIPEYQKLHALYTNDEYTYAISENGNTGYVPNVLITELPSNYIEVDISDQMVYIVNNNEIIHNCEVTTGKPGHETDLGYTEIWAKNYNRKLSGKNYSRDVKYAFFFNNDEEAFHDARWRYEFGGEIYKTNGSLGCINMNIEDVKILDEYTEVGTKVLVHK